MSLTECHRCRNRSTTKKPGDDCLLDNAFQDGPCMGTMRSATVNNLRVWHLVNHMKVWEQHLDRLSHTYIVEGATAKYHELRGDIKKLKEWRERLDSIDPRRNRTDNVPVLQGNDGDSLSQPKQSSINDTPIQ